MSASEKLTYKERLSVLLVKVMMRQGWKYRGRSSCNAMHLQRIRYHAERPDLPHDERINIVAWERWVDALEP